MTQSKHFIRFFVCAFPTFCLAIGSTAHGETIHAQVSDVEAAASDITFSEVSFVETADSADALCCVSAAHDPYFSVRAAATALSRERPQNALLITNPANGAQSINASSFNLDYTAGADISLASGPILGRTSAEIRYLGVDGWDAGAGTTTTGITTIVTTTPPTTFVGGYRVGSRLTSGFDSFEANLRRAACDSSEWLIFIAGFRQLELDDTLTNRFTQGAGNATYDVHADNKMYGGQLGADICVWSSDELRIVSVLKAGVYGNTAKHVTRLAQGGVTATVFDSQRRTSFVGEIGIYGEWDLTCNLQVVGGYHLLWVEDVALATEQIAATNFVSFDGIDSDGGVFYQGFSLGLALTW